MEVNFAWEAPLLELEGVVDVGMGVSLALMGASAALAAATARPSSMSPPLVPESLSSTVTSS